MEIVLFYVDNEMTCGVVHKKIKKNVELKILRNQKLEILTIQNTRIQKIWKTEISNEEDDLIKELSKINEMISFGSTISFEKVKPGNYSLEEISVFVEEKDLIYLWIQLTKNPYIKNKNDTFIFLSNEEIEKKKYLQRIQLWNLEDQKLNKIDSEYLLKQLLDILDNNDKSDYWEDISKTFSFRKNPEYHEVELKKMFQKLNYEISWDDIYIRQIQLKNEFIVDPKSLKFSEIFKKKLKNRKKYTTNTFTIDSEKTKDFDDAFTVLNYKKDEITIAVHISDVSSYLNEIPEILLDSKSRVKSIYLLEKIFPMLPNEFSEDLFSLKQEEERLTISFEFLITKEKTTLKDIHLSSIIVEKNLSYISSEDLMNESYWKVLSFMCEKIQSQRMKSEIKTFSNGYEIDISDRKHISVQKSTRKSLMSNTIINELSILVNASAGKFLYENEIPCIFKSQLKFSTVPEDKNSFYVQCTSPIRRLNDLLNQYQLVNFLEKGKYFTKIELNSFIPRIQTKSEEILKLELRYKNYWILKFLSQNQDQTFSIQIKKINKHNCDVKFTDFSFEFPVNGLENVKPEEFLNISLQVSIQELQVYAINKK
jgi:exoribonuclease R